jgi:nitrate reductase cytochrome c-type subunit
MGTRATLPAIGVVVLSLLFIGISAFGQQTQSTAASQVGMYSGPGGCAASNCHGSVSPKSVTRVWQNEYSIWAAQDKHARAYNMLSNPVSTRMGKILKLSANPNQSDKCLVCHSLDVAQNMRAQSFQMDDGVSCENCHGPAVGWLGPHTTKGWSHEQSLKLGMYDTRDLVLRSEKCMSCHVGTADKRVDHQMIAAGHPDLTFELDSFSAQMPRHWKFPDNQNAWEGVQEWAIGQGVELRETLNRLNRSASSQKTWPEFAELECFECHHSLTQPKDSWRQATGYAGRTPGAPAWNPSRYIVYRDLVKQVSPESSKQLDSDLDQVSALVGSFADREQIAAAAKSAADAADQILQQVRRQQYDAALTTRVMQEIAGDGNSIAEQGERAAEQAAMALDSLSIAYQKNEKIANQPELSAAIDRLFQQFNNPSAYNAPVFAAEMQKLKVLLPHGIQTADSRP